MKVRLTFKSPDVVFHATEGMSDEDRQEAEAACEKWVKYGEYLTVDIDTETGECVPIPK